jgi:hypothetical protein
MGFRPIALRDYVRRHLKSNRGDNETEVTTRLQWALQEFKAGAVCSCGEPIWVIGSAVAGLMCFTCITGSADNSEDYEVDEACRPQRPRGARPGLKSRAPRPVPDPAVWKRGTADISEDDLPF